MPARLVTASLYTLGLLVSFLGITLFSIMYVTGTFDWVVLLVLVVVVNVLAWLCGPWLTALLHRWLYKMRFLTRDEFRAQFPQLEAFVAAICEQQRIKFPRIGFIEDDNPTAYTFGSGAFNARVILTRGLFTYLTEEEVEAVVAHELGHIVHRDFIVMATANTIIQLFYAIYRMFSRGSKDNDKKGWLQYIGLAAYVFYFIGTYIVLYLNRVRESYADQFAARVTRAPGVLSHALVKIGYGIVAKEDSDASKGLLENTATLGIMGLKSAQAAGLVAKTTNMEPAQVSRVVAYDLISPWAKFTALSATHPLIGTRLYQLDATAAELGVPPVFQFQQVLAEHEQERQQLWRSFWVEAAIYYLPVVALVLLPVLIVLGGPLLAGSMTWSEALGVYLLLVGFAYLIRVVYMFPANKEAVPVTMLELMSDVHASPAKGRPVLVDGQIIGRGVPGFAFSEDVMLQDQTGFMYLDYMSGIPLVGNILFAWRRVQTFLGKRAQARGWFFRANTQYIALQSLGIEGAKTFRSYALFWNVVQVVLVWTLAAICLTDKTEWFGYWYVPVIGFVLLTAGLAHRNKLKPVAANPETAQNAGAASVKRITKGVLVGIFLLVVLGMVMAVVSSL